MGRPIGNYPLFIVSEDFDFGDEIWAYALSDHHIFDVVIRGLDKMFLFPLK